MPEDQVRGRQARMSAQTTQVERLLDPKIPIVTKTDLKGKITYANASFVEISGFSLEELIGEPHNIIRHPDMPRDAFKDLWETARADEPWKGLVKNRCKDGGFYWVDAYVTPLMKNGEKIGYMSVRSKPTEQQKQEADHLYRAVNAGEKAFPFTKTKQGRTLNWDLSLAIVAPAGISLLSFVSHPAIQISAITLSVLGSIAGFFWIKQKVEHNNTALLNGLHTLAEGNFKYEVPSSPIREFNCIQTAFKSMQVNLRAIIADVLSGSTDVTHQSKELSDLAAALMTRSQQQSDGINSVAAALEELAVSVKEISDATASSASYARKAMEVAVSGSKNMDRSAAASSKVSQVVLEAKQNIEELNEATSKINSVTQTIQEIAERTNLLALNAAIEAARAGESGRGFAVVADEVRKLAEMTRHSTTEIASTVQDVQTGTTKGQETMQRAVEEVKTGSQVIDELGTSLNAIQEANQGIEQSATDISVMLEQQSQASHEVANSMERMSTLTESNMQTIQSLEHAAKTLARTSSELRLLVQHFEASL